MNPLNLTKTCFTALALLPVLSWALPDDREQPIHIKSDTAEIDESQGISIYRGKVNIVQGSVNLKADQVTIFNGEDGVTKLIAIGKPAHYQQQQDISQPVMHAFGNTIKYFVSEERIEIEKNAKLEQEQNTYTGERIDYDMKRQLVHAYSQNNASSKTSESRVEMIIQPKKDALLAPKTNQPD